MGNEQNRTTNNTFANNSIAGILNAGKANDQTFISVSNNYFANNIIYGNPVSLWVRYGGQNTQAADGWGSGNEYLNNSLGTETAGFLKILNTTYDTYSAFNVVFDPDLTGITIDPELVNPAAANFILAVTSPVIDQGIDHDWQGTVDLIANPIIIPVDYGSYENQEPTYTPTPTPTATNTPIPTMTPTRLPAVSVDTKARLSYFSLNDPVIAYHASIGHATQYPYLTDPVDVPVIYGRNGIMPVTWMALQISSSTQVTGVITDASYEILCSPVIDSGSEVVPRLLYRSDTADAGVWLDIPAITEYGLYVIPVDIENLVIRCWSGTNPSSIRRNIDFSFTGGCEW
jgi:hypothetical protein